MLVSCAAAKKNMNASTGSSKRCVHIFLPRLSLHVWQEPLPLRSCTRYAERSDVAKESSIQHPWCDERSRGVILKGREVRGFLDSGMAGLYEVKTEPCHMVEYLSTAALDLAMLNALSQHNRLSADQIDDDLNVDYSSLMRARRAPQPINAPSRHLTKYYAACVKINRRILCSMDKVSIPEHSQNNVNNSQNDSNSFLNNSNNSRNNSNNSWNNPNNFQVNSNCTS